MKRQEIHDNGGRPFVVDVADDHVIVQKQDQDIDKDEYKPLKKLFKRSFEKVQIGNKPKWQVPENWRPDFVGNTILLELKGGKYLSIGQSIREFKPVKGDTIVEYFSEIGNSDVPYPYAIGKTHVYFFGENQNDIFSMPIEFFDMKKDLYQQLWLDLWINDCKHQPTMRRSDLCKRLKKGDPVLKEQLEYLITNKKKVKSKIIEERDY